MPPLHKLTFDGNNLAEFIGGEEFGDDQIRADNIDEDDSESPLTTPEPSDTQRLAESLKIMTL